MTCLDLKLPLVLCHLNGRNYPDVGLGAGVHLSAFWHASPCSLMECKVIGWCSFHLVPCAPRVHLCGVTAHVGCLEPHLRDRSYAGPRLFVALMRCCHIHLSHALPFFLHLPIPHPLSPFAFSFLVCTCSRCNCPEQRWKLSIFRCFNCD